LTRLARRGLKVVSGRGTSRHFDATRSPRGVEQGTACQHSRSQTHVRPLGQLSSAKMGPFRRAPTFSTSSPRRGRSSRLAAARDDLEAERALRLATARERDHAILGRQAAEDRLRQAKEARKIGRRPETAAPAQPPLAAPQPRRRGRPPKVNRDDTEFVEWWTPGWKEKYR
jgi:hypothetical protein